MIYGNSNDPVLIKKIYLRIWTLRDEVEAVIRTRIERSEGEEIPKFEDLMEEYRERPPMLSPQLEVLEGGASEDAEEGEENAEDSAEEESEEAEEQSAEAAADGDQTEEAQADAPKDEGDSGKVDILQRFPVIPAEKIFRGTTVLSELTMDYMYFFSSQSFLEGQSIVIEFLVPKKFIINASVAYCRAYNMRSRIISEGKLPYRVAVKFSFMREGERTLLRNFVASVEPEVQVIEAPKPSGGGGGGDEDGFDELDDLDL
ncbi:MAG: hypothetical protein HN509_04665 [Halobacteriovoraceae bacterium]|jgi:hypothetical protein|nr:hypothetical protein [Halobacteriovoraceae bacterium]MBT5094326.1 hypothetical protein [Halobacteriovoraceae bacterium]